MEKDMQDKKGRYLRVDQQLITLLGISIYAFLWFLSQNKTEPYTL